MTSTVETHRALYAKLVTSGVDEKQRSPVERAFGCVSRERFLGAGPWHLVAASGYVETPTADPELLYQDVLVALKKEERLNNGQPSMHARNIGALKIEPDDSVVHIGAGSGYYSAILAEITGPGGQVHGYEIDPELAAVASGNLSMWQNVTVFGDAMAAALPAADVIYVNAGVTGPQADWLDALKPGGRMSIPMTDQHWSGGQLMLQRQDAVRFRAQFVSPVCNIPCVGARDDVIAEKLTGAFKSGLAQNTRSLIQNDSPDDTCLLQATGWWLSSR